MNPKLLILIALTDGAKTMNELWEILRHNTYAYGECKDFQHDLDILCTRIPTHVLAPPAIRQLSDGRFELTTDGNVWLSCRPVIRFIVDGMNKVERHGLPRD